MKENRRRRFECIQGIDAADYTEKIQGILDKYKSAVVTHQSEKFLAYVEWEEYEKTPETVEDEYELEGMTFTCGQCPHLDLDNYKGNRKTYPCKYSTYGMTRMGTRACEVFYKDLRCGAITPRKEI